MNYQELIPQRLDIFAFIIFLGVVQGFFFSYFLLKKTNRLNPKNKYLGLFLLLNSAVLLEVFLCYSGLIVHTLWLVDYSEPTNYLSGPVLYGLLLSFIGKDRPKNFKWHFIPALIYGLYMIFFFVQGPVFKFNAYIDAYYPGMEHLPYESNIPYDPLGIKKVVNQVSVLYTIFYLILGLRAVTKTVRKDGLKLFKGASKEIRWLTWFLLLGMINLIFWLVKSYTGLRDVQDQFSAVLETVIIYFVGYKILTDRFSKNVNAKYNKSSLSTEKKAQIQERLLELEGTKLYLDNDLSLAQLAKESRASVHHLSQFLNEELGQSFQDYINQQRIAEAKIILKEQQHLKIEEVAHLAGFNSKSTFNTAFKKISGITPSEYRRSILSD